MSITQHKGYSINSKPVWCVSEVLSRTGGQRKRDTTLQSKAWKVELIADCLGPWLSNGGS